MSCLPQASGRSWRQNTKKAYRKSFNVQRLLFESYVDLILATLIHINQRNIVLANTYCNDKKVFIIFFTKTYSGQQAMNTCYAFVWRTYDVVTI